MIDGCFGFLMYDLLNPSQFQSTVSKIETSKNWDIQCFMFASFPHLLNYHQTTSLTVQVNVYTLNRPLLSRHPLEVPDMLRMANKLPRCILKRGTSTAWMTREGFVRINGRFHPNISHLKVGYNPFAIANDPKFLGHPNVTNGIKCHLGHGKKNSLAFHWILAVKNRDSCNGIW